MKAVVIEAPQRAVLNEVPYPRPGRGELAVKVDSCGICGTDYHIYHGEFLPYYPIIPGHEFSGVVDMIGEGVSGWRVGDRVAVDPSIFCGHCAFCLSNRGNHCVNWNALGNTVGGAMAEYVAVPAKNVFLLPEHISFAEAAFIEPLACVVYALDRLKMEAGSSVLLFGAGSMGMLLVQALSQSGAARMVVTDMSENKLKLAGQFGASRTVLGTEINKLAGHKFDVVVDATGIPEVIQKEFDYLGPCGKYLQFGVAPPDSSIKINPFSLYKNDWSLIGTMAINNTFSRALSWLADGRINVRPLITRTVSLGEVPDILRLPKGKDELKIQIKIRE